MKKKLINNRILFIAGPTGVGKSDIALSIASSVPAEIINMDVGQFYTPLSIGTAKPNWKNSVVPHHLFDIINEPRHYTIVEYRMQLLKKISEVISRGNLPIVVGGSHFYLKSILFPPNEQISANNNSVASSLQKSTWDDLYAIDPQRALQIKKSDTYRIMRALDSWHTTGKKPTDLAPQYDPPFDFLLLFVMRDTFELNTRIYERVLLMLKEGWVNETKALLSSPWIDFIRTKKLIGYNDIINFLDSSQDKIAFDAMIDSITCKTRQYGKRQRTFLRKIEREIKKETSYNGKFIGCVEWLNLTNFDIHLYINELLKRL